ncbi:hypothetical protein Tco_0655431 [Tanacetum coccineum]|uniref:Retrovirus-related Pol polyprotein from transposon TNT 1-94 n=1 Tax=Tanacetum coccineum TaxID=301880 RepID=A0ABQ4X605_9ASTR
MSSAEAEYVPIFFDNTSAIAISNNPVLHSRAKHIDIRYHFIRDRILKGDIELHFVPTDLQLADIFTKPLAETSFTRLVTELGMLNIEKQEDTTLKSITFTLSLFDKPLSFDRDTFSTIIGLDRNDVFVDIPPKETVKAGLATLGLVDKDHPSLSSSDLINSYCKHFVSDLYAQLHPEGSKDQRKPNVCYTRYLSLIMEQLLQDNYKNDKLLSLKPYHITSITFKPTWKNETALTSHMCKVVDLSPEPIQSLIPPSGEVNADDTTNKSLSGTYVPPVTQPKAPTAKRTKKKKIPSSNQLEVLKSSRISMSSSTQATHLQPAEEFVVTADATKSLDASESVEVQGNQPKATDAAKVTVLKYKGHCEQPLSNFFRRVEKLRDTPDPLEYQNIMKEKDIGVHSMEEPTFEQLMDEGSQRSTLDDNVIDITPKYDEERDASDSDLCSMPSDDLASLTGFETPNSNDETSISVTKEHSTNNFNATSDVMFLYHMLSLLESQVTKRVSDELKSSVPFLVSDALKETLPGLHADALKASLLKKLRQKFAQDYATSLKGLTHFRTPFKTTLIVPLILNKLLLEAAEREQSVAKENTETTMVAHKSEDNSRETISGKKDSEDEPPVKKIKVLIPTPEILKPAPRSSIIPEHLQNPAQQKLSIEQFIEQLFNTTSSSFAPSPPREPTPPRDPSKGKEIASEEPMKELIPCIEEGGLDLKMLNIKPFVTTEGEISQEEYMAQIKEMKRLADLKAAKKSLRNL